MRSADSASHPAWPLPRTALRLLTTAGLTLAGAALGVALSANAAADEADSVAVTGEHAPAASAPAAAASTTEAAAESVTPALEVTDVGAVSNTDRDTEPDTATPAHTSDATDESGTPAAPVGTRSGASTDSATDANIDTATAPEDSAPAAAPTREPATDAAKVEPAPRDAPALGGLGQLDRRALNGVGAAVNGVVAPVRDALGTVDVDAHTPVPLPNLGALVPDQRPAPSPEPALVPEPAEPAPAQPAPTVPSTTPNADPGYRAADPASTQTTEVMRPSAESPPRTPFVPATARGEATGLGDSLTAQAEHAAPAPTEHDLPITPGTPTGSAGIIAAQHDHTTSNRHLLGVLPAGTSAKPLQLIGATRTAAADAAGTDTARPTTSPD